MGRWFESIAGHVSEDQEMYVNAILDANFAIQDAVSAHGKGLPEWLLKLVADLDHACRVVRPVERLRWKNHHVCVDCWYLYNPSRVPTIVRDVDSEPCHFCGNETHSGIFMRGAVPGRCLYEDSHDVEE